MKDNVRDLSRIHLYIYFLIAILQLTDENIQLTLTSSLVRNRLRKDRRNGADPVQRALQELLQNLDQGAEEDLQEDPARHKNLHLVLNQLRKRRSQ